MASLHIHRATLALALAAALVGSGGLLTAVAAQDEECTPVAPADIQICHMIFNTSIPFYTNLIKGSNDKAAELGVKVDIVNGTEELTQQIAVIQQFVTRPCSAILVSTSDSQGIVPAVLQANEAGIPVFAVNLLIGEAADFVTYIGVDDYQFGRNQGELLLQALPEGGKVAYMNGKLGVDAQILRKQGLLDVIADHPEIQIVEEQSANWDPAEALALTQDWASKYPQGELGAIVDQGPEGATAAKWLKENGRSDIKFIVGDFPIEVKNGIAAGEIYGTTDQDPYPQGTNSVQAAHDWLTCNRDAITPGTMYLDLPIITIENVDEYPAAWGE
jgi:ABC-type sugar transport system substrate-binding protein